MELQSLSIANLAKRWACSRSAIEDMIKDGRLVATRQITMRHVGPVCHRLTLPC